MTAKGTNNDGRAEPAPDAPAQFELGSLLGYRLLRLSTAIGALAQRESQEVAGLSLAEYRVLVVLYTHGPCGVVALQHAMLIDKAWISRTLTSLSAAKFVASEPDPSDARRTLSRVTPKGRRAAEVLVDRASQRQQRVMAGFSDEEKKQLMDFLARIEANVEAAGK